MFVRQTLMRESVKRGRGGVNGQESVSGIALRRLEEDSGVSGYLDLDSGCGISSQTYCVLYLNWLCI